MEQLGTALLPTELWLRGAEYLRMVAHGFPQQAIPIYNRLAECCQEHNQQKDLQHYRELIREVGLNLGAKNLSKEIQNQFYQAVYHLGEKAAQEQNWDEAINNYSIYTHYDGSGKETLRKLSQMYENTKNVLEALRINEKALTYMGAYKDEDLQNRKDRYYYSLTVEQLQAAKEEVAPYFDGKYCFEKAKKLLDSQTNDPEVLNWAEHLLRLLLVLQPQNLQGLVLLARSLYRRGEKQEALRYFEDVRELKPSGNDESESWYYAIKQLGLMYIDEFQRADLAVSCFHEYENYLRSGGDTQYHLGRCYEILGDRNKAIRHYREVTHFEQHPLRYDAEAAIERLLRPANETAL